jgi:PAS domain S-box-containing protein
LETGHKRSLELGNLNSSINAPILAFLVAILAYLSAKLGGVLEMRIPQTVWPLWPGCAALTAVLLLVPRKRWPVLLTAGLAGFVIYDLQARVSIPDIAWLILADTIEILAAAWGVSYALKGLPRLNSLKALAKYSFFTVFLASIIAASIGINGISGEDWVNWRFSFLSEALAFLTVAPAILGLSGRSRPSLRTSRSYYLEAALLITALISLSYLLFVAPGRSDPPALLYSLVPFLIWSALRFGSGGVGTSATIVALMSIWGAVHGRGPFTETDPISRVLFLQLFLFFTSMPFMVLAVLVEERKLAQAELRKSEERLRSAMESGKAVGWEWNLLTGQDSWFGDLKSMFGVPAESYVGRPEDFHRFVHPEDRQQVSQAVADARKSHAPYAAEFRVVWPDGTLRWVSAKGEFEYSPKGEPERMLGMAVDITERKLRQEELRNSEERLHLAVEAGRMFACDWDAATDVFKHSPEGSKILGVDHATALTGQQMRSLVHPEDRKQFTAAAAEISPERPELRINHRIVRPDGTVIWVERNSRGHFDELGKLVRIVGMVADITERRQAEEAVSETEKRYRRIVETTNEGVWLLDSNLNTSYVNRQMAEMLGYEPAEMVGRSVFDSYFSTDVERKKRILERRQQGVRELFEERLRRRDGSELWVQMAAIPVFKDNGEFDGALAMVSEITERKRAEESLRKSEEKFSKAFRQSPMALAITSANDHRYIDVNKSFERFAGWPREDLIGRTPFDIGLWVDPQDRDELIAYVQNEDSLRLFESRFRMRDGTIRTGLVGAEMIELDGEECVLAVGMDITEQKLAAEALRESESKLRLLLDSTAEAIYGIDLEHRCTFCNTACLRALGYHDSNALLGKNMHQLIHHSNHDGTLFPEEECVILRTLRTGEAVHADDQVLWRANGTSFPVEYWSHQQRRGQEIVGAVVAFIDITERKAAEAALASVGQRLIEAQEQERTRIARELHDDLSQRLALLTIELERLLEASRDLSPETRSRIGELRNRSAEIASDVQSLSHELHSSKLEYLGMAPAMRSLCHELSRQQRVEIVFSHDDIPSTVPKDIALCLFRVLQEALQNAVKHSGVTRFDVELRYASDAINLSVRDSGSGFDPEDALKARGLGLISMTERMKLVGGRISIDSQPQHGTAIRASVPFGKGVTANAR